MHSEAKKVEIISYEPTGVLIKHLGSGREVKVSKRFLQKRLDCGHFEVINKHRLPFLI